MTGSRREILWGNGQGEKFSRRQLLKSAAILAGSAATVVAATGPAQAKLTQTAAGYQGQPKDGAACSNCALFKAPHSCTLVDGPISPDGWCRFYSRKS